MRVLVTGASRGIGATIAKVFSEKRKCNFALVARSLESPSHPKLEGSMIQVMDSIRKNGSDGKMYKCDFSKGEDVEKTITCAIESLGGLDILVNNASMLMLDTNPDLKKRNVVHNVNARATMICIDKSLEALKKSNGKIITISPPIDLSMKSWISNAPCYTISKYTMTLATLGASQHVNANTLWPKKTIATAATKMLEVSGVSDNAYSKGRKPEEFAEAVYKIATDHSESGNMYLDEDVIQMSHSNAPIDLYVK